MYISSVTIANFQSVGSEPLTIDFSEDITTFVGANGTGKTAALLALLRVFGVSNEQRRIRLSDFHIPPDKKITDFKSIELFIKIKLLFPELSEDEEDSVTVPPYFKYMIVSSEGAEPYCSILLEAKWEEDATTEGAITQNTYWIISNTDSPEDNDKKSMSSSERSLIQVHYIPANRNESELLGQQTKLMKMRLFRAIEWSKKFKETLSESAEEIENALQSEKAIAKTNEVLARKWNDLTSSSLLSEPKISVLTGDIKDFVNKLTITLSPSADGGVRSINELSDGQTSLFYFALTSAVFEIEHEVAKSCRLAEGEEGKLQGFCSDSLPFPSLTLFAVEEPENHLAPYYLSRILRIIEKLTDLKVAQSIITSHSSSILGRIIPENVRHFRLKNKIRTTEVRSITFPRDDEEAAKFMREAVLAYPDLYFAKFVILCEGDSEQIVIPKIAESMGIDLDPSFIAIVPLGGRHVIHFWRLLKSLGIPFATLVDLDLGRATGGWERIGLLYEKIILFGADEKELLALNDGSIYPRTKLNNLETTYKKDINFLKEWATDLVDYGVFFSWPLDLDMSMLSSFPDEYKSLPENARGPRLSAEDAVDSVLKKQHDIDWYSAELASYKQQFPFYNYLFLGKSKPVSHLRALSNIDSKILHKHAPQELKKLIRYVKKYLETSEE